ncbi:MAG TPA: 50S ribosomal protein L11 methyltransferase [Gemmatimonadaceae bacterium]|nr:50S ribosomal protein L11 methyltransferase [Gemmatimonadaceae bacterium]
MSWTALRIQPSDDTTGRDAIVAALFAGGAPAVIEDGRAIVTHVPDGTDVDALRMQVMRADPGASVSASENPDVDWSVEWRRSVKAHDVGALTVTPPWLASEFDPATSIVIDPGMAFGTGDHATTRGILTVLPDLLRPNSIVADLGCGSGVLAIAAAKLGASRVYAIEDDADAIGNALANVHANGVSDRVHVFEGDAAVFLPLLAPVDLVLVNIISSVLKQLVPAIETSLSADGCAILSGLLLSERSEWLVYLQSRRWQIRKEQSEGDWWTVAIAKS